MPKRGDFSRCVARMCMTDTHATPNALDALVVELLNCGGALSQIVDHMHAFESSDLASPDAPPTLEVAHSLIRSVLGEVSERHSDEEIRVSAEIVQQVTTAICGQIFVVPPAGMRRMRSEPSSAKPV
jgi:hypothetical protein